MTLDSLSVRTSPGGEVISHSGHSRRRQGVDRRVAEIADICRKINLVPVSMLGMAAVPQKPDVASMGQFSL